jgi:hypothetical protein
MKKAFVCTCRLKLKMEEELLLLADVHKSRMMANIEEVRSCIPSRGRVPGEGGGDIPVPHPGAQVGGGGQPEAGTGDGGAGAQGQGGGGKGWLLSLYCLFTKLHIDVGRIIMNNFFRIRIQEAQKISDP